MLPLTVVYGNAELLLEEFENGRLAYTKDQREELEALRQAIREADGALLKLIEATRGMSVPDGDDLDTTDSVR